MRHAVLLSVLLAATAAHADWRDDLRAAAKQQASAKVEKSLGLPNAAPPGAAVYFINLKNGDTVASPVFVQFGLKAAGISPAKLQSEGTGHHVLLVDGAAFDATLPLPSGDGIRHFDLGQTEASVALAPGTHTLQLLLADWKEQSFNPAVQSDKITITVR